MGSWGVLCRPRTSPLPSLDGRASATTGRAGRFHREPGPIPSRRDRVRDERLRHAERPTEPKEQRMRTKQDTEDGRLGLRIGEVVEVRSEAEILATLDERGELDSLPFMPEMLQFCEQRFTVAKRAMKLCDTITWSGIRRIDDAVHLADVRCDGDGHGGCQAGCIIYWKEAWLRRVAADTQEP